MASNSDWVCSEPSCRHVNLPKRDHCKRCDKRRKSSTGRESSKDSSGKNRGLFSQDDWNCKNCGNINWARRNTCNVCNAPKVNVLGERTGYGGGFMERDDVVEYRHRDTGSDDEFDEFGRIKKPYRKPLNPDEKGDLRENNSKKLPDPRDHNDEDEDEDEDEDSGNDDDLSKYDIWAVDDEQEKTSMNAKQNIELDTQIRSVPLDSSSSDSDSSTSSASSSKSGSSESSESTTTTAQRSRSRQMSKSKSKSRSLTPDDNDLSPSSSCDHERGSHRRTRERSRFERVNYDPMSSTLDHFLLFSLALSLSLTHRIASYLVTR